MEETTGSGTTARTSSSPLTKEQQREARRQKVLARSQAGHPSPVVDLAKTSQYIIGASAEIDEPEMLSPDVDTHGSPGKSAAKLAAERRRQRILAKSNERMAKVQGDRLSGGGAGGAVATEGQGGSGENLDQMLDAAEVEFFGQQESTDGFGTVNQTPAESKGTTAAQGQTYFKSTPAAPVVDNAAQTDPAAQSKRTVEGSRVGAFKSSRSDGSASSSSRRRTGNKALEKQSFDMAAVQSLARSATIDKGQGQASTKPARRGVFGGLGFWVGLEAATKALLLLLVGAGVGGLLMPEGRAAVAQADFAAAHRLSTGDKQWRFNLESYLTTGAGRADAKRGMDYFGGETAGEAEMDASIDEDEFDTLLSEKTGTSAEKEREKDSSLAVGAVDGAGQIEEEASCEGKCENEVTTVVDVHELPVEGNWLGHDTNGDGIHTITDKLLQITEYVLVRAHVFSSKVMPLGVGDRIPCVPAILLALVVRLVVFSAFLGLRILLGFPVFPPAVRNSKPGMIMGMVLATVPMLGKLIAVGMTVKSILSDTTLVVTGTVLTLTFSLAAEEDSAPRRLAGAVLGVLGGLISGETHHEKEL